MKITSEEFARYSQGLSSAEEQRKIEIWLDNEEADDLSASTEEDLRLGKVWGKLKSATEKTSSVRTWKLNAIMLTRIAACLLVMTGLGWYFIKKQELYTSSRLSGTMKTISTGKGERLKVTLPDGSIIQMNTLSELTYPEKFTGEIRAVKFKGEAFFSIARNKAMPFVIQTNSVSTKVLGTKFNLRSYSNEKFVSLTVIHGKVQFGRTTDTGEQMILTKGMQGIIEQGKKAFNHTVDPDDVIAWIDNTFIMNNERLDVVATKLANWYGIQVVIKSKELKAVTVTGTYKRASLLKIMNGLSFSTGLKYEFKNQVLTIY